MDSHVDIGIFLIASQFIGRVETGGGQFGQFATLGPMLGNTHGSVVYCRVDKINGTGMWYAGSTIFDCLSDWFALHGVCHDYHFLMSSKGRVVVFMHTIRKFIAAYELKWRLNIGSLLLVGHAVQC